MLFFSPLSGCRFFAFAVENGAFAFVRAIVLPPLKHGGPNTRRSPRKRG